MSWLFIFVFAILLSYFVTDKAFIELQCFCSKGIKDVQLLNYLLNSQYSYLLFSTLKASKSPCSAEYEAFCKVVCN